mmetsp:Transcript_4931/g.16142  ORF Transcript_4931/g.16142 Transcript_4931/m.16142 type:complete len:246 (-) Transcript_4931:1199-1936(-)
MPRSNVDLTCLNISPHASSNLGTTEVSICARTAESIAGPTMDFIAVCALVTATDCARATPASIVFALDSPYCCKSVAMAFVTSRFKFAAAVSFDFFARSMSALRSSAAWRRSLRISSRSSCISLRIAARSCLTSTAAAAMGIAAGVVAPLAAALTISSSSSTSYSSSYSSSSFLYAGACVLDLACPETPSSLTSSSSSSPASSAPMNISGVNNPDDDVDIFDVFFGVDGIIPAGGTHASMGMRNV